MSADIQQARDVLAKWRKDSTAAPWRVDVFGHGGTFVQIVQPAEFQPGYDPNRFDNMDIDIANIEQSTADARLIVGTAGNPDLLDAIDAQLAYAINLESTGWDDPGVRQIMRMVRRLAAAIIAADERMGS